MKVFDKFYWTWEIFWQIKIVESLIMMIFKILIKFFCGFIVLEIIYVIFTSKL